MEAFGLESYLFKPEYSEEELRHRENELSKQAESVTVDADSDSDSNTANTSISSASDIETWCSCACCSPVGSEKEMVCCHGLFADKLSLSEDECVTNTSAFSQICLQPFSLELCFVQFLRYRKKDPKAAENMTNRQKRLMAYRQLALFSNYSIPLGKGVRIVLPSCCVDNIRSHFPEESADYTGFKEVTEALELE